MRQSLYTETLYSVQDAVGEEVWGGIRETDGV